MGEGIERISRDGNTSGCRFLENAENEVVVVTGKRMNAMERSKKLIWSPPTSRVNWRLGWNAFMVLSNKLSEGYEPL